MNAASTSNANTPYITGRHSPAARRRASTRRQEPGASTAQPMRRPAPPARKMAVSSGAPWAITKVKNGCAAPARVRWPAAAPKKLPLKSIATSAPTPSSRPPAKVRKAMPMLL